MIIDSHVHFGNTPRFHCPLSLLVSLMSAEGIDKAVISYLGGAEVDHPDTGRPAFSRVEQFGILKRTVDAVNLHPGMLYGQLWIQPKLGGYSADLERAVAENRSAIVGLKVHPYHSGLILTDPAYTPYFAMAERLKLPVAVHTASDIYSPARAVYERALEFPDAVFIMVHMGLNTDHGEAVRLIGKLPNLYGDTTWVDTPSVVSAVKRLGSDKILFGTDAPISGPDNYEKYGEMLAALKSELSAGEYDDVLWRNASRLFGIPV
ncbi:MAG: hypothetical protein A2Y33_13350 [Spirochaetes bacterium GWF1_51_8]|nr:MAG: hypothetical protein A2Y33_13350 [Spirochaetes bacterium GWF1_51_8]